MIRFLKLLRLQGRSLSDQSALLSGIVADSLTATFQSAPLQEIQKNIFKIQLLEFCQDRRCCRGRQKKEIFYSMCAQFLQIQTSNSIQMPTRPAPRWSGMNLSDKN